jgi:hypothetical protein
MPHGITSGANNMLPRTISEADAQIAATKHLENDLSREIGEKLGLSKQGELGLSAPPKRGARPSRRTIRAAIRGSVPGGKLKRARITLADAAQLKNSEIGGFTQYDPKNRKEVIKIGAPTGDDAKAITIRGHETRHATRHTPTRKKPVTELELLVGQIVDDVNVESTELPQHTPGLKAYRRAHLTTAMQGVRTIASVARKVKTGEVQDSVALRNGQLLHSVRTLAMLKHYSEKDYETLGVKGRGVKKLRESIGTKMLAAVNVVVKASISRRQRAKAVSMLLALMEREDPPDTERDKESDEDGDILSPVEHGDTDPADGKMELIDLRPKSVYCAKEKQITRRYSPNGVIINPTRYVAAIASGDSNGLFAQRVRIKPGGCVVIDASGSMGASKENLSALCRLVPTATVGYYSGYAGGRGKLAVYAAEGKRYNSELPSGTLMGGNAVDLPAIRWMMKHKKPWTLVSDLEFCGGVFGSEAVAHAIVERLIKRGDLTVYRSLDAAYEAFGGKGELKN